MPIQYIKTLLVIPCLNEEATLDKLVKKLVEDTKDLSAQIIIADGGSTDQTKVIAQKLASAYQNIRYLHNSNRIQSAAVNLAVATYGADADVLIRIDAHADYPADYCQVLLTEMESTGADSVVVAMDTVGHTRFQEAVAAAQNSKLGNGGSAHRNAGQNGKWVDHGHHALIKLSAFRVIGGYDESFSHNEDAEFDARMGKANFKIWLSGKTALTYYPRSSIISLFKQYFWYGHGRARNILKHRAIPKIRQLIPAGIAPILLFALLTPFWSLAIIPLLVWMAACVLNGVLLAKQKQNPDLLLAAPATMLMHAAWSFGFWQAMFQYGSK